MISALFPLSGIPLQHMMNYIGESSEEIIIIMTPTVRTAPSSQHSPWSSQPPRFGTFLSPGR